MDAKVKTLLKKKGHEVFSIQAKQTVYEAIAQMDERNVGALIVKEAEAVAGIITERDYTRKVILKGKASKETAVEEIMTRELVTASPENTIHEALSLMTEKRCRHLPVFKDRELVGMISIGDLVKAVIADQKRQIQLLEEYVTGQ